MLRASYQLSSQLMTGLLVPAASAAPLSHRGTIPAMVPTAASITNAAAWKAFGSPSARGRSRPPPMPAISHANTNPQVISGMNSKLPRVQALGGGFRLPRPQSAPCAPTGMPLGDDFAPAHTGPAARRLATSMAASTAAAVGGSGGGRTRSSPVPLEVDIPDPLGAGKTDSGKVMFEHTLPTDPYGKHLWEEQARKARANMNRHIAAMAAAAAVNGGLAFGNGAVSTSGGSRPASARRGAPSSPTGSTAAAAAAVAGVGPAMRPRFSSATISELQRQGLDYRPQTVLGFAAPDITEDATLPGPNDPRWAYTRLGRTQIDRLQQTLKMADQTAPRRTASEPNVSPSAPHSPGGGIVGVGVSTISDPEHSWGPQGGASAAPSHPLPPLSDQRSVAMGTAGAGSSSGRWPEPGGGSRSQSPSVSAAGAHPSSRPASASMARTLSGRLSSASLVRPGSAGLVRPGSATSGRPGSASAARPSSGTPPRPGSASRAGSVVAAAEPSSAAVGVRGSSAGRTREAAPNPKIDLRAYLAEEQAAAEEGDDEATEMLPVGDIYEVLSGGMGALPAEVSQSLGMVPPEQLAARLAEMVAAAAMVAAQQQMEEQEGADVPEPQRQPAVMIEEHDDDADTGDGLAAASASTDAGGVDEGDGAIAHPTMAAATADAAAATGSPVDGSGRQSRGSGGTGEDALQNLHGTSRFGRAPNGGRFSGDALAEYGSSGADGDVDEDGADGDADGGGDDEFERAGSAPAPLGLGVGLGLGSRSSSRGRPTSARPMSAKPMSARPGSAMPARKRSGGGSRFGVTLPPAGEEGSGLGALGEDDGGMHVIHEHSEGGGGEEMEV
ncbi:hypothetical protein GPECTOR_2g1576 [Gonium pectorale]|uniref:Uncharacterized protein n=1 Tax=Gonium pectorale TaxID=33097 RepID=A0A150H1T8_GONPE|nr:hypothetical protein GPECTOR_2g1576 [Gonium pectorale]|eukprot:KXZ56024.1 hypothetical protein GPECTOR_2g1576 [Gonium pectorale]